MIVFNDTTRLHIAAEDDWASEGVGDYKTVPFIRDNLAPIMVQERPQGLGQSVGITQPITVEESAGGDIEMLASQAHLGLFLPYILNHQDEVHNVNLNGQQIDANGRLDLGFLTPALKAKLVTGDGVLITSMVNNVAVTNWGIITADNGQTAVITGLTPSQHFGQDDVMMMRYFSPGDVPRSFKLIKAYQGAADHLSLRGGVITRLSIDLEEGALPVMSASVLGKEMTVTADTITSTSLAAMSPEFNPQDFTLVLTPDDGVALTLKNTIVSGFRMVLERAGMAPQFALGSTTARYISGGDLIMYGAIDFMLENHDVFTWLKAQKALSLDVRWGDGATERVRIFAPKITFSEGQLIPADDGTPVRAAFQFEVSRREELPLVRIYVGA